MKPMLPTAQQVKSGAIDYVEITLTDLQLVSMTHEDRAAYEALFRAAFDYGLWVTHWHDDARNGTTYLIARDPHAHQP